MRQRILMLCARVFGAGSLACAGVAAFFAGNADLPLAGQLAVLWCAIWAASLGLMSLVMRVPT